MMADHHEFHITRNAVYILIAIQLTALLFGLMIGSAFNNFACGGPGQGLNTTNATSNGAICQLNNQLSGLNSTLHSIGNSFNCAGNAQVLNSSTCSVYYVSGDVLPQWSYQLANLGIGVFSALGNFIYLLLQMLYLLIWILTFFFPELFGGFGGLSGFGILAGILFDGATIIMLFFLLQLIVDRLPWFGKH